LAPEVVFTVRFPTAKTFPTRVVLEHEGIALDRQFVVDGARVKAQLPAGDYGAWVESESGIRGPRRDLRIETRMQEIELEAPSLFDVTVSAVDAETGTPLPGIEVVLTQLDVEPDVSKPRAMSARTGATGVARLSDVTEGTWEIAGTSSDRFAFPLELDLPAGQREEAVEQGQINLAPLDMYLFTELRFRLEYDNPDLDPTAYFISQGNSERIPFDADARATIALQGFPESIPILLYTAVPHERSELRYFSSRHIRDGAEYVIRVGGEQTLEVTLDLPAEIAEQFADENTWISVSFLDDSGFTTRASEAARESGIFRFDTIHGREATVEFGVGNTTWAVLPVKLKPAGVSSCLLRVEEAPLEILVHDGNDRPVVGYTINTIEQGAQSGWFGYGLTDERGIAFHPRWSDGELLVSGAGDHEGKHYLMVDRPVDFNPVRAGGASPLTRGQVSISIAPSTATYIESIGQAESMEWVDHRIVGPYSGECARVLYSSPEGLTPTVEWVDGSQAMVHVVSTGGHWTPTPVFELKPGRNEVEVHDSGQLNISSEALLDRVMSVRYGVPVSTWRAQDNLFQLTTKNGVLRYRTPVGDYDVTMPDGSVERITLTKFQEVSAGI
ncbi:hypothetical protein N9293_01070, partial [Planctomycetota bacterium]|nr:hypothetical protein [Planctomycetota bacterium]